MEPSTGETPSSEPVVVRLSQPEALVLYEWLARFDDTKDRRFEHDAEQKVVWQVEAILERQIAELFDPKYDELVAKARDLVRGDADDYV